MKSNRVGAFFLALCMMLMTVVHVSATGTVDISVPEKLVFDRTTVSFPVIVKNGTDAEITLNNIIVNGKEKSVTDVISSGSDMLFYVDGVSLPSTNTAYSNPINVTVNYEGGNVQKTAYYEFKEEVKPISPMDVPFIDVDGSFSMKAGDSYPVDVNVKNSARDGRLSATVEGNGDVYVTAVDEGRYGSRYTIRLNSNPTAASGNHVLKLIYTYNDNGVEKTVTASSTIRMTEDLRNIGGADVSVSNVVVFPGGPVLPGQPFAVSLYVKNNGLLDVSNVNVTLKNLSGDKISVAGGLDSRQINYLPAGREEVLMFNLTSAAGIVSGRYDVGVNISYNSSRNAKAESNSSFFVDVKRDSNQDSNILIEKLSFPSGAIGTMSNATVSFSIRNRGQQVAKHLVVKALSEDQTGLVAKSISQTIIPQLNPGESKDFTFTFLSTANADTKNYPVNISIEYEDDTTETGKPKKTEQFVGVFVTNSKKDSEKDPKSTPKLIIDKYSFDPKLVPAGSNFDMSLSFYNTNSSKEVRNIKIFLTSNEKTTNESTASGNSVFTPVDSSNTFYIDSIPPGGHVEKKITMFTVPDAAAKTYQITANFEYEDAMANQFTATELIGVPVIQESKLSVGDLDIPMVAMVGEPINVMADFYNTGKVTLFNMMVKLEGDFSSENGTYYVGNFNPGNSESYSGMITPNSVGELKGAVIFMYEDSTGTEREERREFKINIEEPIMPEFPEDGMMMPEESTPVYKNKIVLGAIAVVAIAAGVFVRYRKKKKAEKEMNLDE